MNPFIAERYNIKLPVWNSARTVDNGCAILRTKSGEAIREFITLIRPAQFMNGIIDNVRNSILFKNNGTSNILIDGNWTLKPGEVITFGSSNNLDINFQRHVFTFPSDPFNGAGNNRLEIVETILSEPFASSYQPRGVQLS